jgi:hypothetical protein
MFRKGGRISSDGVGITSGLSNRHRQNYASGPNEQGVQPYYDETGGENIMSVVKGGTNYVPNFSQALRDKLQEEHDIAYEIEQKRKLDELNAQNKQKYNVTDVNSPDYAASLEKTASTLIPFYQKQLGINPENFDRERYLELAKFGLGLLTPAKAGESTKLLAGISRAGIPSITDLSKINQQEILMDQKIKELALNEAVKRTEPGTIQKAIVDYATVTGKPLDVAAREYMSRYSEFGKIEQENKSNLSQSLAQNKNIPAGYSDKIAEQIQAYNNKQTDITKKISPSDIKGQLPANPDVNFYLKNQKKWFISPEGILLQIRGGKPYLFSE